MTDKNKVDDYYSQIPSQSQESSKWEKNPKIITKKKIVVKKKNLEEKKATINTDVKKGEKEPMQEKKKVIIQTLNVVKTSSQDDKGWWRKVLKSNQLEKNNTVVKSQQITSTNSSILGDVKNIKTRGQGGSEKKFFNVKKTPHSSWITSNNSDKSEVKPKIHSWDRKTRRRMRWAFEEIEKENTFIRSNKIAKKQKEEKKVEDIRQNLVEKKWETVIIGDFLTLKELSEKLGVVLPKLIAEFMKNGLMVNINSKIDFETAAIISEAFEIKLQRDVSWGGNTEDIITWNLTELLKEDNLENLLPRSPVVSIMGHVDHGKTSLLDHIREAKVASWEAGWITQSIGAYQVEMEQGNITFLDTPWHEAFTVMRARWAKSTDIAILVVAADEWVKPQTIESINHAKEADIPVIVAINKMDKQWANPDHVKGQLAEHGLTAEDWGGDTPMVPVSAHTGFWVEDLLEMVLLVAEMKELKANPNRNGVATVIESHLDQKLWPVATVLINAGTIQSSDFILCQDSYWKIKVLKNYNNQSIKKALPWDPVLIVWLDKVVDGGDILQVVPNLDVAKQKAQEYRVILEREKLKSASWLDLLMSKIKAGNLKQLKIILKADTNGSLEAMKAALIKLSTPETTVSIIHGWVWSINEWDALMGQWSEAILVGFNVWVLPNAKWSLESSWVEYIESNIIYHITERIEKIVTGMLDPKEVEISFCKALVGGIFYTSKDFMILGLKIKNEEKIQSNTLVRIFRKDKYIWKWEIKSLKQWTLEVKELEWPIECGIQIKTNVKVEEKDILEVYKVEIHK